MSIDGCLLAVVLFGLWKNGRPGSPSRRWRSISSLSCSVRSLTATQGRCSLRSVLAGRSRLGILHPVEYPLALTCDYARPSLRRLRIRGFITYSTGTVVLRPRKVVQWGIAYVAGGWAILQMNLPI